MLLRSGYSMLQGTSMASPEATGGMTLLLSAAKQSHTTSLDPAALRRARLLVGRMEQGHPGVPAGSRPDRRARGVGTAQAKPGGADHRDICTGLHGDLELVDRDIGDLPLQPLRRWRRRAGAQLEQGL